MASADRAAAAQATLARLRTQHPDAHCELEHQSPFQLLVSTVLSAQTTDVNVNKATPALFARWPTPDALAKAEPAEVEKAIGSLGFFRQKTKSIVGLSKRLVEQHGGEVPARLDALVKLPVWRSARQKASSWTLTCSGSPSDSAGPGIRTPRK
jgi:endonuclease-3